MWYLFYNMALVVSAPFILLALFLKKPCRRGFAQRVGLVLPKVGDSQAEVLWVHAVSMGEVLATIPFVSAIHKAYPE
ncbi:MAG: glycosyltransferase N-terminal domain-containing protein, partial [Nitrospirota bacterium]|nr:glycosyltransferase N-terminal domain-containing protein [Nitrospirota bacterium]